MRFSISLISVFLAMGTSLPVAAQIAYPSQVITLTTGSYGKVENERNIKEKSIKKNLGFSLVTDQQNPKDKSQTNTSGIRQTSSSGFKINTSGLTIEQGRQKQIRRVKLSDTYEFSTTTFGQSFSINY